MLCVGILLSYHADELNQGRRLCLSIFVLVEQETVASDVLSLEVRLAGKFGAYHHGSYPQF